jgi:hypothetical protein
VEAAQGRLSDTARALQQASAAQAALEQGWPSAASGWAA